MNRAFVRRTGRRSTRDVLGRRASEIFPAELADRYEAQDAEVFRTCRPLRDELELIVREGGDLGWYLTTKLPVAEDGRPTHLVSVSRDLRTPSDERIAMESLSRVVEVVRERMGEPLRVADLADVAGWSTTQLERRIRRVFGVSVTQYVLRSRVERAASLLLRTDEPIASIAAAAGFYDQADLTRRFASFTGTTPARYRNEHGRPG